MEEPNKLIGEALRAAEAVSAQGAEHPRVSVHDLTDKISQTICFTAGEAARASEGLFSDDVHTALDTMTICLVVMDNGYVVVGKSAPASPGNFDAEKGRLFAFEDAIRQLWPLADFALCEKHFQEASHG